ncbi:MAG: hypothetical protein LBJ15_16740 [Comamonas sp.]|jgi:hypothetical protein|uniref:hypothetical protein n=1 Tax=Comamonas sp. TaxID=34028 RepID=UPI00281711C5|nr:hypothetical protein [Comamonas sp.]MDR0215630.1 hypothetical protein [Comamonas sp.]
MARIEHIKRRLTNWALWRDRRDNHGLGFASRNMLANWMAAAGGSGSKSRESTMPVLDIEAEETDRAVQALKLGKGHLYVTLELVYLRNKGVTEAARIMQRGPSAVHAQLGQADLCIAKWLEDQARARDEQQARDKGRAWAAKRHLDGS